jgi:hypothetical protein
MRGETNAYPAPLALPSRRGPVFLRTIWRRCRDVSVGFWWTSAGHDPDNHVRSNDGPPDHASQGRVVSYKWTLLYIAAISTVTLVLRILTLMGVI